MRSRLEGGQAAPLASRWAMPLQRWVCVHKGEVGPPADSFFHRSELTQGTGPLPTGLPQTSARRLDAQALSQDKHQSLTVQDTHCARV